MLPCLAEPTAATLKGCGCTHYNQNLEKTKKQKNGLKLVFVVFVSSQLLVFFVLTSGKPKNLKYVYIYM